jgi:hypothetical protein
MFWDPAMWEYVQNFYVTDSKEYSKFPCESWEEVRLYTAPWVSGTRTLRGFGMIKVEFEIDKFEGMFEKAEELLMQKAFLIGGNTVHGWECIVRLWDNPVRVETYGSCALLGPI